MLKSLIVGTLTTVLLSSAVYAQDASKKTMTPPVAGANSFTEAQAKDRIEKAGYSQVTALMKGSDGVWQGKAMQGGKSVDVMLDFKGNVTSK